MNDRIDDDECTHVWKNQTIFNSIFTVDFETMHTAIGHVTSEPSTCRITKIEGNSVEMGKKDEIYNPFICAIVAANGTIINLFLFWCVFFRFFYSIFDCFWEWIAWAATSANSTLTLDMRFGVQPMRHEWNRRTRHECTFVWLGERVSFSQHSHMEHWKSESVSFHHESVCHEHYLTSDVNLRIIVVLISIYVVVVIVPSDWLTNNEQR